MAIFFLTKAWHNVNALKSYGRIRQCHRTPLTSLKINITFIKFIFHTGTESDFLIVTFATHRKIWFVTHMEKISAKVYYSLT